MHPAAQLHEPTWVDDVEFRSDFARRVRAIGRCSGRAASVLDVLTANWLCRQYVRLIPRNDHIIAREFALVPAECAPRTRAAVQRVLARAT